MPIQPENKDIPFLHRRWRGGPIDLGMNEHGLILPGRSALIEFYDDFLSVTTAAAGVYGWHEDAQGTPTTVLSQVAAGHGGVALMAPGSTAGNNNHYHYALNTTVLSPFTMETTKKVWLAARFKIEDADQNLLIFGMHNATDDPWNSEPTDQFLFRTNAAAPSVLQFAAGRTASTETTVALNTLADDTWYRALAFYDGERNVQAWVTDDDGKVLAQGRGSLGSTLIPDAAMSPALGAEAVDTGADDFQLDYIYIAQER